MQTKLKATPGPWELHETGATMNKRKPTKAEKEQYNIPDKFTL